MPAERLFDTNILICAFAANEPRSARAEALMRTGVSSVCKSSMSSRTSPGAS